MKRTSVFALWAILSIQICILLSTSQTYSADEAVFTAKELAAKVKPSIFVITVPDRDDRDSHLGSGFLISNDGLVATNLHVVGLGRRISVVDSSGNKFPVKEIFASDQNLDLAILRVDLEDRQLVPLTLSDQNQIEDGSPVVAIGNPLGYKFSIVDGLVSAKREIDGRPMLQLSMPIEPGISGGPVLDMKGRVHGIVTMKSLVRQNLGFAVDVNSLKTLIEKPNPIPIDRWLTIGVVDRRLWTPLFGANWKQRGGRILVDGSGNGFGGRSLCIAKQQTMKPPFELATWVKLNDESGAAGLVFHADGGQTHYGFYPSNGRLRLSRFDGPTVFTWNVLHEIQSEHYRPGTWNHLKVRIEKDGISCLVNDQLVIQSNDSTYSSGSVGLAKFRQTNAEFKHFKLAKEIEPVSISEVDRANVQQIIDQLPEYAARLPEQLTPLMKNSQQSVLILQQQAERMEQRAKELRQTAQDVYVQSIAKKISDHVKKGDDISMLRVALLIARLDGEDIEVDAYVEHVDRLAKDIQATLGENASDDDKLAALDDFLFKKNGFHGSRFDYYHRTNSYMNRVVDDRVGLPITMSVLYIELAKRLGLQIDGIGLPGHFVVKHQNKQRARFIDVFSEAKQLSRSDVEQIVARQVSGRLTPNQLKELTDQYAVPSPPVAILFRLLSNLRNLAERDRDDERVLRYLEAMIAIQPSNIEPRGIRAALRFRTGRVAAAIADLDWFIENEPEGLDLGPIQRMRDYFSQSLD